MKKVLSLGITIIAAWVLVGFTIHIIKVSSRVMAAPLASATTAELQVNTLADELNQDGDCSLREAIEAANTNLPVDACGSGDVLTDTIIFDVVGTITVSSQLSVTAGGSLVIDGGEVITMSGGGTRRAWWVDSGAQLALLNMKVENGYGTDLVSTGGAVYNLGRLIVSRCAFVGNNAPEGGGAIHNEGILEVSESSFSGNGPTNAGGAINNLGTLSLMNSLLSQNHSSWGGAINNAAVLTVTHSTLDENEASWDAGAINNTAEGTLTLTDSTLIENHSGGAGAIYNAGRLMIEGSTLAENSSLHIGGAIANEFGSVVITGSALTGNTAIGGGAIWNEGPLTVTNSTLSGNSAGMGGAMWSFTSDIWLSNTTVTGNSADQGGGLAALYTTAFHVLNSIIANNSGGECYAEQSGVIIDGGHNISSDDTCGFDPANGSMPNTDPLLRPLEDNGGPTWTHALLPGSPAIDAGDDAQCLPTDQRGMPRPRDGDGDQIVACDIGSYELQDPWVSPTQVTISGPDEANIRPVVYFTATVEPVSTTVLIQYVWWASGHPPITETRGLTDTVGWAWELPGTYAITVTASNPAGVVSDTHVITITEPLFQFYIPWTTKAPQVPFSGVINQPFLLSLFVGGMAYSSWVLSHRNR